MSRELDDLLQKLTKLNTELGGDSEKKKSGKKRDNTDRFLTLKNQVGDRLHRLKQNLTDPDAQKNRSKHPREVIRRQQEIRENIRLVGQELAELKSCCDGQLHKKNSKFSPEDLQMRKDIVSQYTAEYALVKELASAGFRSPRSIPFSVMDASTSVGLFSANPGGTESSSTSPPKQASGASVGDNDITKFGLSGKREGNADFEHEQVTESQQQLVLQINAKDQQFDQIIDQIGTGVQELGQLAQGLNEELQHQSIMIDGLETTLDKTKIHAANLNRKMKETLTKSGRSGDKCMMDIICLILLLGVVTVVYNTFFRPPISTSTEP